MGRKSDISISVFNVSVIYFVLFVLGFTCMIHSSSYARIAFNSHAPLISIFFLENCFFDVKTHFSLIRIILLIFLQISNKQFIFNYSYIYLNNLHSKT